MRSDFSLNNIKLFCHEPGMMYVVVVVVVDVVVVVVTLKTVLTSIQYPSLSYSSRQRNEFPCHKLTQNKVQNNNDKIKKKKTQRKSQHCDKNMIQVPENNRFRKTRSRLG